MSRPVTIDEKLDALLVSYLGIRPLREMLMAAYEMGLQAANEPPQEPEPLTARFDRDLTQKALDSIKTPRNPFYKEVPGSGNGV